MTWLGSSFRSWLLIKGVVPLLAIFVAMLGAISMHCRQLGWSAKDLYIGALRSLPFALFLSYCLVPSVSKSIFQSWSCIAFEVDGRDVQRISYQTFLRSDLSVRCSEYGFSNTEHNTIKAIASVLLAIWPVGMVVMCAAALLPCRTSLRAHKLTPLNRATKFLHQDYRTSWFAWELLDINRRTFLVGWVIFVFDTYNVFLRLVAASLLSTTATIVLLSIYPWARPRRL